MHTSLGWFHWREFGYDTLLFLVFAVIAIATGWFAPLWITGLCVFFCAYHVSHELREIVADISQNRGRHWRPVTKPLFFALLFGLGWFLKNHHVEISITPPLW